jgi:ATP-binding cassette subfamily B protein
LPLTACRLVGAGEAFFPEFFSIMSSQKSAVLADPTSRNLIRRVLRENFHLYVGRYIMAFILMACTAAATAVSVFLMQNITAVVFGSREATQQQSVPIPSTGSFIADRIHQISEFFISLFVSTPGLFQIFSVSIAIVFVFLIKGLSTYGSSVILTKIGNNIVARQQRRLGNHVLDQSLAFFVHFPSSDLITRVSQAASSASTVMNLLMTRIQDVLTAIALLLAMFKLDWQLTCAALFIFLPITFSLSLLIKRIRKIANSQFKTFIQVISAIQEAIIGNKLIKSYNLENSMRQRFDEAIRGVEKLSNKMAIVTARTSPIMEIAGPRCSATDGLN